MSFFKLAALIAGLLLATSTSFAQGWVDHTTSDNSTIVKRHETGSAVSGNKLYAVGGRGNRPVQVFDATQNKWSTLASLPLELHHFQPVILNGYLYVIGAFTCCFPTEPTIADIYRLNLSTNTWETHGAIPNSRLRGSAGTVVYNNKIYLIGGNTNGHSGGAVGWLDEYNPSTGVWRTLPDAPNARDHFSAAVIGHKLIAASGRQSNVSPANTVAATDVYDFITGTWTSVAPIPTPRAGAMLGVKDGNVIIIGGESITQVPAHDEVEAYHVASNEWRTLPALDSGRHGGASGLIGNTLHAVTGNTVRGGGQEVTTHEKLALADSDNDGLFDFEDNTNSNDTTLDTDNDGLNDQQEIQLQTDIQNPDSDSDGLQDGEEVSQHQTDPLSSDTDNDGLNDGVEVNQFQTDPLSNDSDNDGLRDGVEVNQHQTDPLSNDSDNDGLHDGVEVDQHQTDPLVIDSDGDGLGDAEEITLGTNPNDADSDQDGLTDIDELQTHNTDPTNNDSDADSLTDGQELHVYFTDPLLADSDNDSLDDGAEVFTHNSNPNAVDSDGDGISDAAEVSNGTSVSNNDEDGDGILNSAEGHNDSDGDSIPDFLDLDSDNDGIPDIAENARSDNDNNGKLDDTDQNPASDVLFDADQDGINNLLDLDSDQDGLLDLLEAGHTATSSTGRIAQEEFIDANQNGWHDTFEGVAVTDTDADATPDYLDLDSNDDGVTDLSTSGIVDLNGDGIIDNFTDNNQDGVHDDLAGLERTVVEQEPGTASSPTENQPGEQTPVQVKSGGGSDPLLPIALLILLFTASISPQCRTIKYYCMRDEQ